MRSALAFFVVWHGLGCSADAPATPRPLAELDSVEPTFAPSSHTVREALGVSYEIPIAADAEAEALREHALTVMQDSGMRWVRRDILWHEVQPTRDSLELEAYRGVIGAGDAVGVETVPLLVYGTPWASSLTEDDHFVPPDDPEDFARFAGSIATELGSSFSSYEIWNEPNLGWRFWKPREDPAAFAELATRAARAVREVDADASICLGGVIYHPGLSRDGESFLEGVYRANPEIAERFDAIGLHPYPVYPPSNAPELEGGELGEVALGRMISRMRALMAHYEHPAAIWVTEMGWPTFAAMIGKPIEVTEEEQARWLVRALFLSLAHGADRFFWFTLIDGPEPESFPPEQAFGLWKRDPDVGLAPKASWRAAAAALALAGDRRIVDLAESELDSLPADAFVYRLAADDASPDLIVLWRSDDDQPAQLVSWPQEIERRSWNLYGEEQPPVRSVQVGPGPIYLEWIE